MNTYRTWKGKAYPLGATAVDGGVNFALFSEHATGVELCLFDEPHGPEIARIPIREQSDYVWHIFLPDVWPGQLYGYRVDGPYAPNEGHRFNKAKLLLDPYAKAIAGKIQWGDEMFGYGIGNAEQDLSKDERDNAALTAKSVVIDPSFNWGSSLAPNTPLCDTIIYETHVRGFSKLWELLPEHIRGTYGGLANDRAIEYFKALGVTAIELLPVHHHIDSKHLLDKKLADYWGYNTIGFFAPEATYSSADDRGGQVQEFKMMVKRLHEAGLEVILDVVYNHTVEGNQMGPTLSFRGIDNKVYYRLTKDNARYYHDYTGTGNTLNVPHPRVLQLLMDSLRYWVTEMKVDGFRFDLASTLARGLYEESKLSAFFDVIHQDPIISQVKLIAEPWDLEGYHVGNFPILWAEWNGRYRDVVRRYWKGDPGCTSDFAYRLSGSSDLYESNGRKPTASINFVTAHDGFTLRDLVSFNEKHNQANGEDNRDGENNNNSWDCGHEGLDAPEPVRALRGRMLRNFLSTLFLSQGVPMLRGGDEHGGTQQGNNNAYCQDNELSWMNWNHDEEATRLLEFTKKLIHFRKKHPIFHQPKFFQGRELRGNGIKDITWINSFGKEMSDEEWQAEFAKVIGVILAGESLRVTNAMGELIRDDTFLLFFNAHHDPVDIIMPGYHSVTWSEILNSSCDLGFVENAPAVSGGAHRDIPGRSLLLFQKRAGTDDKARTSPTRRPAKSNPLGPVTGDVSPPGPPGTAGP